MAFAEFPSRGGDILMVVAQIAWPRTHWNGQTTRQPPCPTAAEREQLRVSLYGA